jgi:hypothetical protein
MLTLLVTAKAEGRLSSPDGSCKPSRSLSYHGFCAHTWQWHNRSFHGICAASSRMEGIEGLGVRGTICRDRRPNQASTPRQRIPAGNGCVISCYRQIRASRYGKVQRNLVFRKRQHFGDFHNSRWVVGWMFSENRIMDMLVWWVETRYVFHHRFRTAKDSFLNVSD